MEVLEPFKRIMNLLVEGKTLNKAILTALNIFYSIPTKSILKDGNRNIDLKM